MRKRSFTLIELLIAIVIIGIVVALVLPEYGKVVRKTKGVEAKQMLSELAKSAEIYYIENGWWPDRLGKLDAKPSAGATDTYLIQTH
jgi:prepilin-type N-terminal cleavage/methylation domain-containing protein